MIFGVTHTSHIAVFFGRFHAVLLHFPIGVLGFVLLLEIWALWRPSRDLRRVIGFGLGLGMLTALSVAILGVLLSKEGGYEAATLRTHKILGFSVVAATAVAAALHALAYGERERVWLRRAYRLTLVAIAFGLMAAGHYGGNLTHGSQYLVEYAPDFVRKIMKESGRERGSAEVLGGGHAERAWRVLSTKCQKCHGQEKQKGNYRLDNYQLALRGGESGEPAIVPGEPMKSNLARLILLPEDHDEVMPPAGKEKLTEAEVMIVLKWIREGAPAVGQADGPPVFAATENPTTPAREAATPVALEKPETKLIGIHTLAGHLDRLNAQASVLENELAALRTLAENKSAGHITPAMERSAEVEKSASDASPDICTPSATSGSVDVTTLHSNPASVSYIKDIKAIMEESCVRCHDEKKQKGKLRLDSLDTLMKGGSEEGPAVIAGKPEESPLYKRMCLPLEDDPDELGMPPKGKGDPVPPEKLALVRAWIQTGAR